MYVWHGQEAGLMEKNKAANLAQALSDERGGKVARFVFDSPDDRDFFKAMGKKRDGIKTAEQGGSDEEAPVGTKRLCKVSDSTGAVELTEVSSGDNLNRDQLKSEDVFVLDDGYEVTVWIGLNARLPSVFFFC